MADDSTIPIQLLGTLEQRLTERNNPMSWDDAEPATGVFIGTPGLENALDLLGVPGLSLPELPRLPEDFEPSDALRSWAKRLGAALRAGAETGASMVLPLDALREVDVQALTEILGEGEVAGNVTLDDVDYTVSESTLAGVWRVQGNDQSDWVEVACVPDIFARAAGSLESAPFEVPAKLPGVMNAPAVLVEISERASHWQAGKGESNHVMNFTLLPMSEADHQLLTRLLSRSSLELRSGGFGDCHVMGTRYRHVWAVQFVNAMGHVILDTVEIGDMPSAVAAATQDLEDSAERLEEILGAYL